jgi:hypothetical protein
LVKICDVAPVMRAARRVLLAPPPARVAAGAGASIGPIRLIPKTLLVCRDTGALALAGLVPASAELAPMAGSGKVFADTFADAPADGAAGPAGGDIPGAAGGAPGFLGTSAAPAVFQAAKGGPGGDWPSLPGLPPGELLFGALSPPPSVDLLGPGEPNLPTMTEGTDMPSRLPTVEVPEPSAAALLLLPLAAILLLGHWRKRTLARPPGRA